MIIIRKSFPTIFLILISFQSATAQNAEEKKVKDVLDNYRSAISKAMLSGNFIGVNNFCSNEIRTMPEFQKATLGKSNMIKYYTAFSGRFIIKEYTRKETEILNLGSQIVEFGNFEMKLILRSSGHEYLFKGKYGDIWEKRLNDSLLLITQVWNYNHKLENNDLLKFDEIPAVTIAFISHVPVNSPISFELAALSRLQEICITQHDPIVWSQFYSNDAKVFYNFQAPVEGRNAIDSFLKKHVTELPVFEKLDIRNDRIDHLGNFVIVYASHIAIVRNGDWSGVSTGKNIAIWKREKDGSLKIFRGFATYD